MQIKDLKPKQGKVEVTVKVVEKGEPRTFSKFNSQGQVCNAKVQDDSGSMTLSLWNDQVNLVHVGDTISIKNGYVSEWQGEMQLSTGKFGTLDIISKGDGTAVPKTEPSKEPTKHTDEHGEEFDEDSPGDVSEEDFVDKE